MRAFPTYRAFPMNTADSAMAASKVEVCSRWL